jgi:hypothetical protein
MIECCSMVLLALTHGGSCMNTDTEERRAFVEAILHRLRCQYAEQARLPGQAAQSLSLELYQRLARHVISERYGE